MGSKRPLLLLLLLLMLLLCCCRRKLGEEQSKLPQVAVSISISLSFVSLLQANECFFVRLLS